MLSRHQKSTELRGNRGYPPKSGWLTLFSLGDSESNMKITFISAILMIPLIGRSGEIERLYNDTHSQRPEASEKSRTYDQANSDEHEITEVGLERPPWYFVDSPVYTVIIKADGRFTYTGERNVQHLGRHTGQIETNSVKPLFQLIREMDYFSLDDYYSILATDKDTAYTMVAKANQRKIVSNYGKAGPLKLWALEQLIDALLTRAHWDHDK